MNSTEGIKPYRPQTLHSHCPRQKVRRQRYFSESRLAFASRSWASAAEATAGMPARRGNTQSYQNRGRLGGSGGLSNSEDIGIEELPYSGFREGSPGTKSNLSGLSAYRACHAGSTHLVEQSLEGVGCAQLLSRFVSRRIPPDKRLSIPPASENAGDCEQKNAPHHGHHSTIEAQQE